MSRTSKKVYVGISGGVDSATSAALLKQSGYDVTGVFIKIWSPEWTRCTMAADRKDAMRVCASLDIPYKEIDCSDHYRQEVITPMITAYKRGDVPNPDVLCNKYVKFGAFFDYAMSEGADFVATGHYAQVKGEKLLMAKDTEKDQTYFLWQLDKNHLRHTLFPIGHLEKETVRTYAKKLSVPVASKKDSQGLCFLGDWRVDEFLKEYIPPVRGDVLDEAGNIIGHHDGIAFLTIGSRHGFTVEQKHSDASPLYIIKKNSAENSITVSHTPPLWPHSVHISVCNWITPPPQKNVSVRLYHRSPLYEAHITDVHNDSATVRFTHKVPATSSGQSLVFYDGDTCLGGGIVH